MRAVVQRVSEASVTVDGEVVGQIGPGLCVLLGVAEDDSFEDVTYTANKVVGLRIFEDDEGKMNRSLAEQGGGGAMLVVSQFTLFGDCRKGRRPSFIEAARPEVAEPLYEAFVACLERAGVSTARGVFGAEMRVRLLNDGPVTVIVEKDAETL